MTTDYDLIVCKLHHMMTGTKYKDVGIDDHTHNIDSDELHSRMAERNDNTIATRNKRRRK